ncbi:hypothetical protein QUF70_03890 [Desulfobacterales bacterium HSG17]|nr:hypothetical protein [Desulfobacterales bacterium HSG17]
MKILFASDISIASVTGGAESNKCRQIVEMNYSWEQNIDSLERVLGNR